MVEQKKALVTGAAEAAVAGRSFLVAMGRADTAVHVQNDHLRRAAVVNLDRSKHRKGLSGRIDFLPWAVAPSRSVPCGWWKRPVFRRPCRRQSNPWQGRVPDDRRRSRLHSRQAVQRPIDGMDRRCPPDSLRQRGLRRISRFTRALSDPMEPFDRDDFAPWPGACPMAMWGRPIRPAKHNRFEPLRSYGSPIHMHYILNVQLNRL